MRLRILHTNDLHGHLEHWPVIDKYLKDQQTLAIERNEPLLTLDIGDAMDSVHPLVEATYGKVIVDLFNDANYDVVTLGNNEGLNFSKERLIELYSRASFDISLANLLDDETEDVPVYAESIVYREINEFNIAFIGLTAPYQTYNLNGYKILDPLNTLQEQLDYLHTNKQIDLIILLSHLGITTDRYIANLFPQVDLIIGAHTHHVLIEGDWENQTFLCAAGKYGNYVGEIDLIYQEKTRDWHFNAQVLSVEQLSEKYQMPKEDNTSDRLGRRELRKRVVAHLPQSISALKLEGEQSFIQFTLEAIAEHTKLDFAILNSGLFLSDLGSGIITENDLHEALPHPMHLCIITMTGSQLIELFNEMYEQSEDLKYKLIHGLGFRGKIFGELVMKGFHYNSTERNWYANNNVIDEKDTYQFVTVDHLWFLPYFPALNNYGNPQLLFPDFIRHVVRNHLEKLYPIESS